MKVTARVNIELDKPSNYIPMGFWNATTDYYLSDLGIPFVKRPDGSTLGYSVYALNVQQATKGSWITSQWRLLESAEFLYMQAAYIERIQFETAMGGGFEIGSGLFQSVKKDALGDPLIILNGTTGYVKAETGVLAGWEFTKGRIGKTQTGTGTPTSTGLALYDDFIKFSDSESSVFLGTNVLPASTGMVGMGRITNSNANIRKIGLYFDMAGADTSFWDGSSNNIAIYINRGVIAGAKFNGVNKNLTSAGYTIGKETVVCIYTTANYTVRLPANPEVWEFKWIFGMNNQNYTLSGNGKNIWSPFVGSVASLTFGSGMLVYTGQEWAIFS